jgi:hypothetical protein
MKYIHVETGTIYELVGAFGPCSQSGDEAQDLPADPYTPASGLRLKESSPVYLTGVGYRTASGIDYGPLVFYWGEKGRFVRLLKDFTNAMELI